MIVQKLSLGFLTKILIQFLQLVSTIVVARIAGPTVLGTITFGLAFVNMFRFMGTLGLGSAHFKIMNEEGNKADCTTTYALLHLITKTLFLTFVTGYFLAQKYLLNFPFESKEHEYVIIVFMITIFLETIIDIPKANFGARTEQAKQDIPDIMRELFASPAKIIVVILGGTALALAFTKLASLILIIPVYIYLFRSDSFGRFDKQLAKRYLIYGLPLIFLGVSQSLLQTLDKVLLQYFTNSEQVGYYSAGFRIGSYFMMIAHTTGMIFFPLFSRAVTEKKFTMIKSMVLKYERFCLIFLMPMMIFLALYSDSIVLLILGEKYIQSIPILTIITLAMLPPVLSYPYGNIISGFGDFKLVAKISFANIIILVIAMLFLITPHGLGLNALGAAWAYLISQLFLALCFRYFARKKINEMPIFHNSKYLLFGCGLFISMGFLYHTLMIQNIPGRIFFPLLFFSVSYLSLYVTGMINKSDLQLLLSLVSPGKMKNYLRSELK